MKTAVVIGGGFAGLAAAKVLLPHYNKVLIYDKNEVKHSLHQHVLLKTGQIILEKIFPRISNKFIKADCQQIDWSNDTVWENMDGRFPRYQSSIKTLSMSRSFLQSSMTAILEESSRVQFIDKRIENLSELDASLVVIAGGQSFPFKRFLGDVFVRENKITINLTYRSYVFNLADLELEDFKQYYFQIDPPRSFIGGVICPIEDGKAMVTIIAKEESIANCDSYDDFLRMTQLIPGKTFYNIIKNAKPLSKMAIFRKVHTHRRILDDTKIPKGVIILGDVLNSLNPVFGQGMTLALQQVEALDEMLKNNEFDEVKFHRQCNKLGRIPHFLSKTGSKEIGILKSTLRSYLLLCQKSKLLHFYFLKILHTLGSPGKIK